MWKRLTMSALLVALAAHCGWAATLAVNTSNSGGFTNLDSVVVDDARGTITAAQMTNVTVFQFNNGGGNNSNLIQPGGVGGLPAPRQLVMQDFALNNGVINPGAGTPKLTGSTLVGNEVGMGLRFNSPVTNGAGIDALFFELSVGGAQAPDPVSIALLDETNTVIGTELTFAPGDFGFNTDQLDSQVVAVTAPVNSLTALNNNAVANGGVVDSFYNLLDLDFSDFGIAEGDRVSGLFVRGANIDPTLVAGLPTIPEPSTIAIWSLLGIVFGVVGWRRSRRKK